MSILSLLPAVVLDAGGFLKESLPELIGALSVMSEWKLAIIVIPPCVTLLGIFAIPPILSYRTQRKDQELRNLERLDRLTAKAPRRGKKQ